jgi:hypothetical protein
MRKFTFVLLLALAACQAPLRSAELPTLSIEALDAHALGEQGRAPYSAIVGNVQAGWFGLTEDYPFYKESDDRTAFISTATYECTRNTYAEGNTLSRLLKI